MRVSNLVNTRGGMRRILWTTRLDLILEYPQGYGFSGGPDTTRRKVVPGQDKMGWLTLF